MTSINYVKFVRGTLAAFKRLPRKDPDTLYFISESKDGKTGQLYLGEKLLVNDSSIEADISLDQLTNILIDENIDTDHVLAYNKDTGLWNNTSLANIFANNLGTALEMRGATQGIDGARGLVPTPRRGNQNSFLRGDGTWAIPIDNEARTNVTILQRQVGTLSDLFNYDEELPPEQQPTIVDSINELNLRLYWKELDN